MKNWTGSAAVCVNENDEVLMVLQGKPEEHKVWALPSGGKEADETYEQCCIREVWEETGYEVEVVQELHRKRGATYGYEVTVQYFEVKLVGGTDTIQDPDGLIYEIGWKSLEEIASLELSFPEDREFIVNYLTRKKERN